MLVDKKRLFIAVDITESIRNDLRNEVYKNESIGKVSWVKPDNLHITLKFLGNVSAGDIDRIAAIMDKAATGKGEITLTYTKMGVFPNLSRPRVLWVGFEEPSRALKGIVMELEEGLSSLLGTAKEKRPFVPHLTVARIKDHKYAKHVKLSEFIKKGVNLAEGSFKVSQIVLYNSELKPSGAVYTKVRSASLK
jgi:2'-5' RNA ligase